MSEDYGQRPFSLYTVYRGTSDYPGKLVVRPFVMDRQTKRMVASQLPSLIVHDDGEQGLALVREMLTSWGLTCLPRSPEDDPVIVESWI